MSLVLRALFSSFLVAFAVTQAHKLEKHQERKDQSLALKQAMVIKYSEVECSEEYGCAVEGDSLIDTITNVDEEMLCQQLCQVTLHTCKKRVMLRRRLFWPKKIAEKVRKSRQNVNRDKSA